MQQLDVKTKQEVWHALGDAGLISHTQVIEFYHAIAQGLFDIRVADPSPAAVTAYFEQLLITSPMDVPMTRWDVTALAYWGYALLNFEETLKTLGLVEELRLAAEMLSHHRAFLHSPELCLLWMVLTDTFKLRIVSRVYARGKDAVKPVVFQSVEIAV